MTLQFFESVVSSFEEMGRVPLPQLAAANRQARTMLARSCGSYIGLRLAEKFARPSLDEAPSAANGEEESKFIDTELSQLTIRVQTGRMPFEREATLPFDAALLELEDLLDLSRLVKDDDASVVPFYAAVVNAWLFPQGSLDGSAREVERDLHFLWGTSISIERCLRRASGRLSGLRLEGITLLAADLSDVDLSFVNFGHSDLSKVILSRAKLVCTDLSHASLQSTLFDGTNLTDADLSNADFGEGDKDIQRARFEKADFTGTNWNDVMASQNNAFWKYVEQFPEPKNRPSCKDPRSRK